METKKKTRKGLTAGGCARRARRYIKEYGICLLVWDVKGSSKLSPSDRCRLTPRLKLMMKDLNSKFNNYFPKNDLANKIRIEKGFQILHGDCSWAGINNAEIVLEIINYQNEKHPDVPLHWGVAKDGWDKSYGIPWR